MLHTSTVKKEIKRLSKKGLKFKTMEQVFGKTLKSKAYKKELAKLREKRHCPTCGADLPPRNKLKK